MTKAEETEAIYQNLLVSDDATVHAAYTLLVGNKNQVTSK
jgi:hypothetical protein